VKYFFVCVFVTATCILFCRATAWYVADDDIRHGVTNLQAITATNENNHGTTALRAAFRATANGDGTYRGNELRATTTGESRYRTTATNITATVQAGDTIIIDFGGQQIEIGDEILQNGWFNYDTKQAATNRKTIAERAKNLVNEKQFEMAFPDIVNYVKNKAVKFEIKPNDGRVIFHPHKTPKFTVNGQMNGRKVNYKKLYADILKQLQSVQSETPQKIVAEYLPIYPTPKGQIVKQITKRGEFSTHFENNPPREHNIALAISQFNGLVAENGAEISFNKTVGARTENRGYQESKIIIDGEYVEGIGGGVCQASTTVFNAVIRAGLHITESHNHSLTSSYVPLGCDAMVSSAADLRFLNNTGAPVYFETHVANNRVFVTIYGRNKGDNVHYKLSTQTTKEYPPPEIIDKDANIDEIILKEYKQNPELFDKIITQKGENGYAVTTFWEVYKGERLLNKKVLRRSVYKPRPTKYKIVKKPPPPPLFNFVDGTAN
jgi:vancomycin resistance protein YoaR